MSESVSGMFINSGSLFSIAKQAYERAKVVAEQDRAYVPNEPLIAVVFAAAAGEAFINEIGELASQSSGLFPDAGNEPDQVQNAAHLLKEIEDARGTTNLKFLLCKLALTGKTFDKGTNPYQDFAILSELRNSLMHLKFDRIGSRKVNEISVRHPGVIDKLRSKNILAQFADDENAIMTWLNRVSTTAVARWSCNATAAIVKDIVEAIPSSELRSKADLFYYRFDAFAPVA